MARLSFVSANTTYSSDFLTAYCWSSKGDGVDLLYKVINNDVVTGRWCFTVVTTADTNDW